MYELNAYPMELMCEAHNLDSGGPPRWREHPAFPLQAINEVGISCTWLEAFRILNTLHNKAVENTHIRDCSLIKGQVAP